MAENEFKLSSVPEVAYVSSRHEINCPVCTSFKVGGPLRFADSVNHLIGTHGWKLLHVGGEHASDARGKPMQHTVAVLGARVDEAATAT